MVQLNVEREKLAKETEEKEFKKYVSFYFLRKAQENALKQKVMLITLKIMVLFVLIA